jgi:hypothetical protein
MSSGQYVETVKFVALQATWLLRAHQAVVTGRKSSLWPAE